MPDCEFSEEEFEFKFIKELCDFYGWDFNFYKPTRNKEKKLGFDFAISTYYSKLFNGNDIWLREIRNILGVKFNLPIRIVSSFIQTKIPFFVSQKSKLGLYQWKHWNSPFYRIDISNRNQLNKLAQLERGLSGHALVRYAAPCFNTFDEFDRYLYSNMICQKTHFQSPSRLLKKHYHKHYTYQKPLPIGIAFSEPEEIQSSIFFDEIFESILKEGTANIFQHIDTLYEGFLKSEAIETDTNEKSKINDLARDILGEFYDFRIPYLKNIVLGENFAKGLQIKNLCRKLNLKWIVF